MKAVMGWRRKPAFRPTVALLHCARMLRLQAIGDAGLLLDGVSHVMEVGSTIAICHLRPLCGFLGGLREPASDDLL
jgi:hypothetical protein